MLAFALLALFAPLQHALFLAGFENGQISMLCEGESAAYVSAPDGSTATVQLDTHSQGAFTPSISGPHSVQCAKEAKTIDVRLIASAQTPEKADEGMALILILLSLLFIAFMLALSILIMRHLSKSRTEFTKHVAGDTARLTLRAGQALSRIEISDPIEMDTKEKELRFSIPLLSPGQLWQREYTVKAAEKALPASLEAEGKEGKIALLSRLFIEGKEGDGACEGKKPEGKKRKLQKA